MKIIVMKFGGSSLSNNLNLNIVANKIIKFKKDNNAKIVVVVSAQGNDTNNLIKEAKELSSNPNKRELDALLSTGEIKSAAKLSILLNRIGYKTKSLNAYQTKIRVNGEYGNARIKSIDSNIILKELEDNDILIITGFQGINDKKELLTLGRGGSDTTCVAIAKSLNLKDCYICSDVDGIYKEDPNIKKDTTKLERISYDEMETTAYHGAKVLHDRCINIARESNIKIHALSTFKENKGTIIDNNKESDIEKYEIKNIIKCKVLKIELNQINEDKKDEIIKELIKRNIRLEYIKFQENKIIIYLNKYNYDEFLNYIENKNITISKREIVKMSIVGYGISNNESILQNMINSLKSKFKRIEAIIIDNLRVTIYYTDI